MASIRMAAGLHSRSAMMWTRYLPAAVAATSLASLHRGERHLRLLASLAVTPTGLYALAAPATESELA